MHSLFPSARKFHNFSITAHSLYRCLIFLQLQRECDEVISHSAWPACKAPGPSSLLDWVRHAPQRSQAPEASYPQPHLVPVPLSGRNRVPAGLCGNCYICHHKVLPLVLPEVCWQRKEREKRLAVSETSSKFCPIDSTPPVYSSRRNYDKFPILLWQNTNFTFKGFSTWVRYMACQGKTLAKN